MGLSQTVAEFPPKTTVQNSKRLHRVAPARASKNSYLFVDNVRFLSMFAIIAFHATAIFDLVNLQDSRPIHAIDTIFKFGTIAFFLISGFLLGDQLETLNPVEYFKRRLEKVFAPWLLWFVAMLGFRVFTDHFHHRVDLSFGYAGLLPIYGQAVSLLTTSAFWFVPNLLLALLILLVFRRYIGDLRMGAALLAIDIVYVVNIYKRWMPTSHTEALFGFVFFLWLGAYASLHFDKLQDVIAKCPTVLLIEASFITGLLAYAEARVLDHLHCADPVNTLRLSNQLFSVAVVLLLLKLKRPTWPAFVSVRRHTFGLYLSHTLVLSFVTGFVRRAMAHFGTPHFRYSRIGAVAVWAAALAVTYSVALLITKAVDAYPRLQWAIGSGSKKQSGLRSVRTTNAGKLQPVLKRTEASI